MPAMLGGTLSWAFYFYWYNIGKRQVEYLNIPPSPAVHFAVATSAGIMTAVLTNPIWVIKTRLQLQASTQSLSHQSQDRRLISNSRYHANDQRYNGFVHGLRLTVRDEGWGGLYRGLGASLWLVSHGALQFAAYEEFKYALLILNSGSQQSGTSTGVPTRSLGVSESLIAASASKVVASVVTYPLQVVRTRMQQRGVDSSHDKYGSLANALRMIYAQEGMRGFYKGLTANVLRVTPSAAITFVVYESVVSWFRLHDDQSMLQS